MRQGCHRRLSPHLSRHELGEEGMGVGRGRRLSGGDWPVAAAMAGSFENSGLFVPAS